MFGINYHARKIAVWIGELSERAWESPKVTVSLWLALTGTILWFLWSPPSPGMAAIILGALAAVMTLRDISPSQKFFVMLAVFVLAYFEIRGINRDRATQDLAQLSAQKTLQDDFEKVLAQNQTEFEKTEDHMEQAIAQSELILKNVTGGGNFLIVKAIHTQTISGTAVLGLSAFNDGDVPLYDPVMCVRAANHDNYEGCPNWPVLPAHDQRASGFAVSRNNYEMEVAAATGSNNEILTINPAANTEHIAIKASSGQVIYDREISIP